MNNEEFNAQQQVLATTVGPQSRMYTDSVTTTYSWKDGELDTDSQSTHIVGTTYSGDYYEANRMYMSFNIPTLPRNPRIKKAELTIYQKSSQCDVGSRPKLGLYQIISPITNIDFNDPQIDLTKLIDFAPMKHGEYGGEELFIYTFDITTMFDQVLREECYYPNLGLKFIDESEEGDRFAEIYGSGNMDGYAPQISINYESTYGVNTSYRTHTHSLGRFGQGSVDLQCGNLMFESEDFAWAGNRMPVTIKHLYNTALREYQYTNNSSIQLNTADFSAMKIGNGFKLNVMQSMMPIAFVHEGEQFNGYVYTGENGEETYFKPSEQMGTNDDGMQSYCLYEDVNGGDVLYDPNKLTLTQGEDVYLFDNEGRLIRITDAYDNHKDITYTAGKITAVTDGVGRVFTFAYTNDYLTSITAPDGTSIRYTYSDDLLSSVTYPDGRKARIAYFSSQQPTQVTLLDAQGNDVYMVMYEYCAERICNVTEYGVRGIDYIQGAITAYDFSVASGRTLVETYEQFDEPINGLYTSMISRVYAFDDDGNIVSEYAYTLDGEKAAVQGEGSGINPYSGDNGVGVVSNINNLLRNHSFYGMDNWHTMGSMSEYFTITSLYQESTSKYGSSALLLAFGDSDYFGSGIYQETDTLPKGRYTFSAYLQVIEKFYCIAEPGAYLRVCTTDGTVLAQSELLHEVDTEYTRLMLPFELTSAQRVRVQVVLGGKGKVRVDAAQLENNDYSNAYNLLENGNFELYTDNSDADSWENSDGVAYTNTERFNMTHSLMMTGDLNTERTSKQTVKVKKSCSTRETFTLSGWAKGYGLPDHERDHAQTPTFRLRADIKYKDEVEPESHFADFSPCTEEWQMASVQFSKKKYCEVEDITVSCEYGYNFGTVYFDDIQLVRNGIETDLTAADFMEEPVDQSEYDAEDDTEVEMKTEDEPEEFKELLDRYGNKRTETTFADGEFGTIYRSFTYSDNKPYTAADERGNDLIEETDARANTTRYTVDPVTSRNEQVTDRLGNKTAYEYDVCGRTTKVTSKDANDTELATVSYSYNDFDNLTEIVRGDGLKYVLTYNAFHGLESIGIDGKAEKLVEYTHNQHSGRLKSMTYANGHTMKAIYNTYGQLVAEKWYATKEAAQDSTATPTAHYKYTYDGEGNIVSSVDFKEYRCYNYEYEEGRLIRATESSISLTGDLITRKSLINTVRYYYDADGKMIKKCIIPEEGTKRTIYYENSNDSNTVVKFKVTGTIVPRTITSHSKNDSFGRKVFDELQIGTGFVSREFRYLTGDINWIHRSNEMLKSTPTTQLVSEIIFSDGRTISYEYDKEERITRIDDSIEGVTEYTYDALGQLLTETVNGCAVNAMTYDNYGNILTKNGVSYQYDSVWKDRLISVGEDEITYDAQANPITYFGNTLIWEKGRQLAKIVNPDFEFVQYAYNANGIRISKIAGSDWNGYEHHYYTLEGTKILRETVSFEHTIEPMYDNEDSVCGIIYDEVPYYFQKNLQGDVIGILDEHARIVGRYTYDAWGAVLMVADDGGNDVGWDDQHIGNINPFRYRGYYYDKETGLYYLQSRYYDPKIGRFINGDTTDSLHNSKSVLENNLFVYCQNDPVNESDYTGSLLTSIIKKILTGLFKGFITQLGVDFISYLYKLLFVNSKTEFKISSNSEYLKSIASAVITELVEFLGAAKFVIQVFTIVGSYFTKLVNGRMKTDDWITLVLKLAMLILKTVLLKKLNAQKKNELKKLKQYKNKKSRNKYYKNQKRQLKLKYESKGFKINLTFDITEYVVDSFFNILTSI